MQSTNLHRKSSSQGGSINFGWQYYKMGRFCETVYDESNDSVTSGQQKVGDEVHTDIRPNS